MSVRREKGLEQFVEYKGTIYRQMLETADKLWLVCYTAPAVPVCAFKALCETVPLPDDFLDEETPGGKRLNTMQKRKNIIRPLTEDTNCITDLHLRAKMVRQCAAGSGVSEKTICRWYYAYLAKGNRGLLPQSREKRKSVDEGEETVRGMRIAINRFYFSPRKMSLRDAYSMYLLESWRDEDGRLLPEHPSFYQFQYTYRKMKTASKSIISREGIGIYQRDHRPLTGKGDLGVDYGGVYEMDATQADIHLVSRYGRKPIGRPYIYIAVDVASRLIAGIHIGLEGGADAVLSCLANACADKTEFCRLHGVKASAAQWPAAGLPAHIVTDRGRDFMGRRVGELCARFGVEITNLPAYRPDLKGYVEKAFDCIQSRYKPLLAGKGVIEMESPQRGLPDYREGACLDIEEFTRIILHCVLYYNSAHCQQAYQRTPQMVQEDVPPVAARLWDWLGAKGMRRTVNISADTVRLMLMPRDSAVITRQGILFRSLYYEGAANDFTGRFMEAAVHGRKKIEVAYQPEDANTVYWVRNGQYFPLKLTPGSRAMQGLCFEEVRLLRAEDSRVKKAYSKEQEQGAVACTDAILKIAKQAREGEKEHG